MENFKNKEILEKYTKFKQLGQGAISGIYYAETKTDNQPVAIKVVTKQRIQDQQSNRYFEQELEVTRAIMAQGKNENIVNILELVEGENEFFIVTEYCQEGDLLNLLERFSFKFQPDVAISFCIAIANGLNFLHKNKICHRDLKPENILISKQADGTFFLKISDFGISKQSEEMMKSTIGTITYMAPEILKFQNYNEKVDIWSFGCLAYEIFVGEQLFGGRSQKEVAINITTFNEDSLDLKSKRLPKSMINLLKKCLKKLPQFRFTLDQVIQELLKIKAEFNISMTQSILVQSNVESDCYVVERNEAKKQVEHHSVILEQNTEASKCESVIVVNSESSNSNIKFTDNLNDSFDNYVDESTNNNNEQPKQEDKVEDEQEVPLQLTQAYSQIEGEDQFNYITPKNNNNLIGQNNNNNKVYDNIYSLDHDLQKFQIQQEYQKEKKHEEKIVYNEKLQKDQERDMAKMKLDLEKQKQNNLSIPQASEKKPETNNTSYQQNLLFTPQSNKTKVIEADHQPFLSEQRPVEAKTVDNKKQSPQQISQFSNNTQNGYDNIQKITLSPQQTSYSDTKKYHQDTYKFNTPQQTPYSLNTDPIMSNLQKQNLIPFQSPYTNNTNLSPTPAPYIALTGSPSNNSNNKDMNLQNSPHIILNDNLNIPSYKDVFSNAIKTPTSASELNSKKEQDFNQHTQNNNNNTYQSNLPKETQNVQVQPPKQNNNPINYYDQNVQQNNVSDCMQMFLSQYVSQKEVKKPKQKQEVMNNSSQQKQFIDELEYVRQPEIYFIKDLQECKYKFKNVWFKELLDSAPLPCVEIEGSDDLNILEFMSLILTWIDNHSESKPNPLKAYINSLLQKKMDYIHLSDFLKKNQYFFNPFLKLLLDLVDNNKINSKDKKEKLYEYMRSQLFSDFLKTFGNFQQNFGESQIEYIQLNQNTEHSELERFRYFYKLQKPFKIVQNLTPLSTKRYFVSFHH